MTNYGRTGRKGAGGGGGGGEREVWSLSPSMHNQHTTDFKAKRRTFHPVNRSPQNTYKPTKEKDPNRVR